MAPIPALWATKKYYSTNFQLNGTTIIDLKKAGMTNEYVSRLMVRVFGTLATFTGATGAAGVASGLDNPEGFLTNSLLTTSPTQGASGLIAFNNVSARGLRTVKAINKEKYGPAYTAIVDAQAGNQNLFWEYEFTFKRNHVRKNVEYGLDMSRFTSVILNLTFGSQTTLFTGSTTTWTNNLTLELWADVGYSVDPDGLHAIECFEQTFPVVANGDLLINQLPTGVIYSDLYLIAEQNNVPFDGLVNNIDIEGGGRNWTYAGDNNANLIRDVETLDCFDGSVSYANVAGQYFFRMRDGSFLRGIDATSSQIVLKVNITGWEGTHTYQLRLIGKKMVPYGVAARNPHNPGTTKVRGKR